MLLNLELLELLETTLDQVDNLKERCLGVEHSEAARKNFDQVLRGLLLVFCQLVLSIDDVELLFE